MRLRYQNGKVIEGVTLSRTGQRMRIAVSGGEDAMELTNVHGIWVSDDCEPVTLEIGMTLNPVENYSDDYFICPQELASHLVQLLFSDSTEHLMEEPGLVKTHPNAASTMIA
jgi:hypothetical protein